MKVDLAEWSTPNFVTAKMPAGKREDGFHNAPTWHIRDVDEETLDEQCNKFRAEIFQKAGKVDPLKKEK